MRFSTEPSSDPTLKCSNKLLSNNSNVRPFDISVIVLNPDDRDQIELATRCYRQLYDLRLRPLLDDRSNRTLKDKAALSDFYGIPLKIIIGERESNTNSLTIKTRDSQWQKTVEYDMSFVEQIYHNT